MERVFFVWLWVFVRLDAANGAGYPVGIPLTGTP